MRGTGSLQQLLGRSNYVSRKRKAETTIDANTSKTTATTATAATVVDAHPPKVLSPLKAGFVSTFSSSLSSSLL